MRLGRFFILLSLRSFILLILFIHFLPSLDLALSLSQSLLPSPLPYFRYFFPPFFNYLHFCIFSPLLSTSLPRSPSLPPFLLLLSSIPIPLPPSISRFFHSLRPLFPFLLTSSSPSSPSSFLRIFASRHLSFPSLTVTHPSHSLAFVSCISDRLPSVLLLLLPFFISLRPYVLAVLPYFLSLYIRHKSFPVPRFFYFSPLSVMLLLSLFSCFSFSCCVVIFYLFSFCFFFFLFTFVEDLFLLFCFVTFFSLFLSFVFLHNLPRYIFS